MADSVNPPPTPRRSLGTLLFSSETKFGRALRLAARWLAIIGSLLAAGFMAGYFVLHQPTLDQLNVTAQRLTQSEQALAQRQTELDQAIGERDAAQQASRRAEEQLKTAASENQVLAVLLAVHQARITLLNKDGAATKAAIEGAQQNLAKALPFLEAKDKTRSDLLKARLDLAAKELVSDPAAALADLDKLAADLADFYKKLFAN